MCTFSFADCCKSLNGGSSGVMLVQSYILYMDRMMCDCCQYHSTILMKMVKELRDCVSNDVQKN